MTCKPDAYTTNQNICQLLSNKYITRREEIKISEHSRRILIRTLYKTASEWMKGRNYNPSFFIPPTPFHIVLVVKAGKMNQIF